VRQTIPEVTDQFSAPSGVARRPVRKLTGRQVAGAAELYERGASLGELGEHFGVDPQTINRELQAAGVRVRPRRGM
jgi:hypothetical protein